MTDIIYTDINIACVADANYAAHLATLLHSIESNSSADERVKVHVIHDSISADLQENVTRELRKVEVSWYCVVDHAALKLPPLLQISRATYLRLIIDEIVERSHSRLIFLDIDMVVTSSLEQLWSFDLGDSICAAVRDPGIDAKEFAIKHNLDNTGDYFNAGVLLFDMERVRSDGTLRRALDLLLEGKYSFEYADQDALNVVLWKKWMPLDATWNFQREFLYDGLVNWRKMSSGNHPVPKIIHFTESVKPWKRGEWHPFAWLYWKYLFKSGFGKIVMEREHVKYRDLLKMWLKYSFKKPRLARGLTGS